MKSEIERTSGLPVGSSELEVSGVSRGTLDEGFVGGAASLRSHFARERLAFLSGAIGYSWDGMRSGLEWEVLAGIRMKF